MGEKYDHGPNMAAMQTYQTSFATGDLDKLIGVLVSRVSSKFELFDLMLTSYFWSPKDDTFSYTSRSQPGHKGIWETNVVTK